MNLLTGASLLALAKSIYYSGGLWWKEVVYKNQTTGGLLQEAEVQKHFLIFFLKVED